MRRADAWSGEAAARSGEKRRVKEVVVVRENFMVGDVGLLITLEAKVDALDDGDGIH